MTSARRLRMLVAPAILLVAAFDETTQAQPELDPSRYEIGLEYARPDRHADLKPFSNAFFLSGRFPVNIRFAVRSEVSLVQDRTGLVSESETRFGSVYIGGEYADDPNTVQLGL